MKRAPKPIPISRLAKPESGSIAWLAEPKPNVLTGSVKSEEKDRAKRELEAAIKADGFDPAECELRWTLIDTGWGWTARVREKA